MSARERRPSRAVQVAQPRPWGLIATSVVLTGFCGGIVTYAALNVGQGRAELKPIAGVVATEGLSRDHVAGPVAYPDYPQAAPVGGQHNAVPANCNGRVYSEQIPAEHAVHSLEHGAVWITYRPDLPNKQVQKLADVIRREQAMLSPLPGQDAPIALQAWGLRLTVESASDDRVDKFVDRYAAGPQAPEPGASCSGTTRTGTTPLDAGAAPVRPPSSPAPVK